MCYVNVRGKSDLLYVVRGSGTVDEEGSGGATLCFLGLKMRTRMRPKMMSNNRKMHFLLPVFF